MAPSPEVNERVPIVTTKKKRNKFVWRIESEWDDLDAALEFLTNEGFVMYDWSDLKCGQKFYFRCKRIPKERDEWCGKRFTLFLLSNNLNTLILTNQFDHNHDKLLEGKVRPPSDEIEEFIYDLFECGTVSNADVIRHIDYKRTKFGLFNDEQNPPEKHIEYMIG